VSGKISVAMAVYNGEKYIAEQINSLLIQSVVPDEIIICDDSRNDSTFHAIQPFIKRNPRIINYHHNDIRLGVSKNFEKAISLTTGDIVFLSDQDDVWLHDKIKHLVSSISGSDVPRGAFCDSILVDENLNPLHATHWDLRDFHGKKKKFQSSNKTDNFLQFCRRVPIAGHNMAFSAKLKNLLLPFPDLTECHDTWIGLVIAATCGWTMVDETLTKFRQHQSNVSHAGKLSALQEAIQSINNNTFGWHVVLYDTLLERLLANGYAVEPQIIDMIRDRREHSAVRERMNCDFLSRTAYIIQETRSERYFKFGRGWVNIVQDLFVREIPNIAVVPKKFFNIFFPGLRRRRLEESVAKLLVHYVHPMQRPPTNAPLYIAGLLRSHAGAAAVAKAQLQEFSRQRDGVFGIDLTAVMRQSASMSFSGNAFNCSQLPASGTGTVLIHLTPPDFIVGIHKIGQSFLRDKYIVGYWAWELEKLPPWWLASLDYLHEVWVGSEFNRTAVQACTDKPVKVIPYPMRFQPRTARPFAVDGKIRVLFIFDFGSSYERKNPMAAVTAFKRAFADSSNVELVLKAARTAMYPPGWLELQNVAAESNNIRLIDSFMSQEELDGLYCKSDIYLSLHRSEGLGITILEAMRFGLHCVATGWSGNMEFFHGDRCHTIDYKLVSVFDPQGIYPYPECRWADPDIVHAASILVEIAEHEKHIGIV